MYKEDWYTDINILQNSKDSTQDNLQKYRNQIRPSFPETEFRTKEQCTLRKRISLKDSGVNYSYIFDLAPDMSKKVMCAFVLDIIDK